MDSIVERVTKNSPFASPFTTAKCESKDLIVPRRNIVLASVAGKVTYSTLKC